MNLWNKDGSMNMDALNEGHMKAWEKINEDNMMAWKKIFKDQDIELPIRRNSEVEFYPDGSLKRYKY